MLCFAIMFFERGVTDDDARRTHAEDAAASNGHVYLFCHESALTWPPLPPSLSLPLSPSLLYFSVRAHITVTRLVFIETPHTPPSQRPTSAEPSIATASEYGPTSIVFSVSYNDATCELVTHASRSHTIDREPHLHFALLSFNPTCMSSCCLTKE